MPNASEKPTSAGQPARRPRRLGIAVQGLGGAVATTAVAGLALLRRGQIDTAGLPLAGLERRRPELFSGLELAGYDELLFGGWDLFEADLAAAARTHAVLPPEQLAIVEEELRAIRPWQAVTSERFVQQIRGSNVRSCRGHREAIESLVADLTRFREAAGLDAMVLLNLSSTERRPAEAARFDSLDALERALDADDPAIGPSVLYAYAALSAGVPHVNFTPTRCTDLRALLELARRQGVPVCGRDGKTGQTFLKTVLAPALRDRNLHVEGWFSTNLLGNRDGEVLADPQSLASKVETKTDVLEGILGYPPGEHQVHIHYYKPRGDAKEAWDNIDLVGFGGHRMQVKIDFLCRDSILAAPMAIDLCRLIDLAHRRGEAGAIAELGVFFKRPMTLGGPPEHDFTRQQAALECWLASGR